MISQIDQRLRDAKPAIERWFAHVWCASKAPIYSSVDVRNAGFKLAPVDTNLFPGGWNNLSPEMAPLAAAALRQAMAAINPRPQRVLIVPENHTRNGFYLRNVLHLQRICVQAGLQVRVGSLNPEIQHATEITLPGGESLMLEPVVRRQHRLVLQDFDPCLVLLNHDLSAGVPDSLLNLQGQQILPPLQAGWHVRRKHQHCAHYEHLCEQFADAIGVDPWWINPMFSHCDAVDFADGTGLDALKDHVDALLTRIRTQYRSRGIDASPFVIIKADNGTYGMGIMTVRAVSDLDQLNRKTRNKMNVIKDGQTVREVLIQEGVPTLERIDHGVAEPVVYLMHGEVVGGFYRVHAQRGVDENLNAPGATFAPLQMMPEAQLPAQFYANGVIARLATLAAAHELHQPVAMTATHLSAMDVGGAWGMPFRTPSQPVISCSW